VGLKQDVVIVNEYSVPLPSSRRDGGPRGSRGGTPGAYVLRYMAREAATETITPIRRRRTDHFTDRYQARERVTESADVESVSQLKSRLAHAHGLGGVAFGYGEVSLSHDQIKTAAADVQRLFDSGHTVMKTVVSFTPEYLKRHRLVPGDLDPRRRGDYQGQVDQLKLRMALMHGLARMGREHYDDLRYVGVIQIDTEHVHCHLAMVDAGHGNRAADGTQKGKISARSKSLLRRGVDSFLNHQQHVPHLSAANEYERRNVVTFVKRWAHQQMLHEALPQFLLACLPEDRRLWRLSSDRPEMRKPHRIIREMVEEVLSRPGSPLGAAMEHTYVDLVLGGEGQRAASWRGLGERGREQLVERGVTAVYALLRQLPQDVLRVRTPMLDAMSMDYEDLAARVHETQGSGNGIVSFGFRLRSYSARLEHHTARRERAHRRVREWEAADSAGMATPASRALHRFWQEEEEYHARVAAKYRWFLPFAPSTAAWRESWERLEAHRSRLLSLESMRHDQYLRMAKDPGQAERIGRDVYGHAGGHLLALGDAASVARLEERIHTMRTEHGRQLTDLRVELAGQGLVLEVTEDGRGQLSPRVSAGAEHPFEEVKGLDLHHLRYDFSRDIEVGARARAEFVRWSRRRGEALDGAVAYLEGSGQAERGTELPVTDVVAMTALASEMERSGATAVLPSGVAGLRGRESARRSPTVSLTHRLSKEISRRVDEVVNRPAVSAPGEGRGPQQERHPEVSR
jgi:hypothetical protein